MRRLSSLLLLALLTAPVSAQFDNVGTISFPTSGSPQAQQHFLHTLGNLRRSVGAGILCSGKVVRADIYDCPFRVQSVELAVVQPPKDILCPIPTEAHVESSIFSKSVSIGIAAISFATGPRRFATPKVSDGIAD